MGKGNFTFRGADGNSVRTFYADLGSDFESEKKAIVEMKREDIAEELRGKDFATRRRMVAQMAMDGRLPVERSVSDDRVYDAMTDSVDDELSNISYEVGGENGVPGFERLSKREYDENFACGNRDSAVVLARSANSALCVGDNESSMAIAVVPTFDRFEIDEEVREEMEGDETIRENAEAELEKTRKRADANYEITGSDIGEEVERLIVAEIDRRYDARRKAYLEEANAAMRKIHEYLGGMGLRVWTSAWTQGEMFSPEEMDSIGMKYYN